MDDIRTCEQADAFTNRREAQLLAILAKSLDEAQALIASAYYRERAERRERELSDYYERAGAEPCMAIQFKRQ
ncbi:MAG TPA: hypothetical protein VJQ52_02665 [Steroidobacteraceae bacterium]|nr:hypothetical protein [Steroidobacteraceae bacterium]